MDRRSGVARPQIFVSGELDACAAGPSAMTELWCHWYFPTNAHWSVVQGQGEGETFTSEVKDGICVWNQPVDVHLAARSMESWPKMEIAVWGRDQFSRSRLAGYGMFHVPTIPGCHDIIVPCWRPCGGRLFKRLRNVILGSAQEPDKKKGETDFSGVVTEATCSIAVHLNVVMQNFEDNGVHVS